MNSIGRSERVTPNRAIALARDIHGHSKTAGFAVLEERREKTRALTQAMMQELLTGRTPLV